MIKFYKNREILFLIVIAMVILLVFLSLRTYSDVILIISTIVILLPMLGFTTKKHWEAHQLAECTREKMIRNLTFDLVGLLLTMGAALYVGRLAGEYFGLRVGFWLGLLAGFLGGFLAAWLIRFVWGKLVVAT